MESGPRNVCHGRNEPVKLEQQKQRSGHKLTALKVLLGKDEKVL